MTTIGISPYGRVSTPAGPIAFMCSSSSPGRSRIADRRRILGQRDELGIVRHGVEPALAPIFLGLRDPFGPRGDEVPPEMTRPVHRLAAEHHEPGRLRRANADPVAGAEDQQLPG